MKNIFLFLFLVVSSTLYGQTPSFKVLAVSQGATLNGKRIRISQVIPLDSSILSVPKDGYIVLLHNPEDWSIELKMIKVGIADIKRPQPPSVKKNEFTMKNDLRNNLLTTKKSNNYQIEVPRSITSVGGDSIMLYWIDKSGERSPYIIEVRNLFDDILRTDTVMSNWKMYDRKTLIGKQGAVILKIVSINDADRNDSESGSGVIALKSLSSGFQSALEADVAAISVNDPGRELKMIKIYGQYDLPYEQFYWAYKLKSRNRKLNDVEKNYLTDLSQKYRLRFLD